MSNYTSFVGDVVLLRICVGTRKPRAAASESFSKDPLNKDDESSLSVAGRLLVCLA